MKTDNELIAEFMGFIPREYERHGRLWRHPELAGDFGDKAMQFRYDTSWSDLMPVVEKIDNTIKTTKWIRGAWSIQELPITEKIDVVYKYVVEFIKWYNTQKTL